MKLFSERFKDVEIFPLATYSEVVEVRYGYAEATDPNTINILCSRKWGFVEVEKPEEPTVLGNPEEPEEVSVKEEISKEEEDQLKSSPKSSTKGTVKIKKSAPTKSRRPVKKKKKATLVQEEKKSEDYALSESDVDALIGQH